MLLCDCTSFMDSVMKMMYPTINAAAVQPSPEVPHGMLSEQEYCDNLFENIKRAPRPVRVQLLPARNGGRGKIYRMVGRNRETVRVRAGRSVHRVEIFSALSRLCICRTQSPYSLPREQWPAWLETACRPCKVYLARGHLGKPRRLYAAKQLSAYSGTARPSQHGRGLSACGRHAHRRIRPGIRQHAAYRAACRLRICDIFL